MWSGWRGWFFIGILMHFKAYITMLLYMYTIYSHVFTAHTAHLRWLTTVCVWSWSHREAVLCGVQFLPPLAVWLGGLSFLWLGWLLLRCWQPHHHDRSQPRQIPQDLPPQIRYSGLCSQFVFWFTAGVSNYILPRGSHSGFNGVRRAALKITYISLPSKELAKNIL